MIQHSVFESTGGFVLHKVMVNGQKYSVWYDKNGTPSSAEWVLRNFSTRNVPSRCGNLFAEFKKIGQRYKAAA